MTVPIFKRNDSFYLDLLAQPNFNHLHLKFTPSPEKLSLVFTINVVQNSSNIIGLGIA